MQLESFLQLCRNTSGILDVNVEEITDSMLAQITSKDYTLTERPKLFKFTIQDSVAVINLIIPHQVWSNLDSVPTNHLLDLLNRIDDTHEKCIESNCSIYNKDKAVYFLRPDTLKTYCLVGRSIDPKETISESLSQLVNSVKQINNIGNVTVYDVVDSEVLALANTSSAVFVVCEVQGSTEKTENIVPDFIYNSIESHESVCDSFKSNVEKLLK